MTGERIKQHRGRAIWAKVLLGVLLIFLAVVLLRFNEGEWDLGALAGTALVLDEKSPPQPDMRGRLVALEGPLRTDGPLGDPPYLKAGPYLVIHRQVEMYAWIEEAEGGEASQQYYHYEKAWTAEPPDSRRFRIPEGHLNPSPPLNSRKRTVNGLTLGSYALQLDSLQLPEPLELPLSKTTVNLAPRHTLSANLLFVGQGTPFSPHIGDLRIRYRVVPAREYGTVLGKLFDARLTPYHLQNRPPVYRLFWNRAETVIAQLRRSYLLRLWGLRLLSFLMTWLGVYWLLSSPIDIFSAIRALSGLPPQPLLRPLGRATAGAFSFLIALFIWSSIWLMAQLHPPLSVMYLAVILLVLGLLVLLKIRAW